MIDESKPELRREDEAASGVQCASDTVRFMQLFDGHGSVYGVYNGITEERGDGKKIGTDRRTVRSAVTVDLYERHLAGKNGLGICPIRADSTVRFGAIDIDVYAELSHATLAKVLTDNKLPLLVCRSKSGGAHIYCFASEPVPARLMVDRLKEIAATLGHGNAEIFPKQIAASDDAGGNWINLPYFNGLLGTRYAVKADGDALEMEEFLDEAETLRQPLMWFEQPITENARPIQTVLDEVIAQLKGGSHAGRDGAGYAFFRRLRVDGYNKAQCGEVLEMWTLAANEAAPKPGEPEYTAADARRNCQSAFRKPLTEDEKGQRSRAPREPRGEAKDDSQADKLFKLIDDFECFHSGPARDGYVRLRVKDHKEVWELGRHGGRVREILTHRYFEKHGRAPSGESLTSVIETVRAKCRAGAATEVYVRFARSREVIYLDLGDDAWRAVKITATGWDVVTDCPALFRRPSGARALPVPVSGGSLDALRPLLNAGDDRQWTLILAWLAGVFLPSGSFAHLVVEGRKGSGKTSAVSMLQSFLDPSEAGLSGPPKNEEDAILSALNTGILAFDNLSGCRADFSDTLCRFSTGAAFRTRTFYENLGLTVIRVQVPCLLNGIDAGIMRDDMMERSITLTLPYIAPTNRVTEAYVWSEFHKMHGGCLGAMLDAVVTGLRNLESTVLPEPPRMADLCTWVAACEPALPWKTGEFLKAFVGRQKEANAMLIENHELAQAIVELVIGDAWVPAGGYKKVTLQEFYTKLNPLNEAGFPLTKRNQKYWPQSAISLSHKLKRLQSLLKEGGVEITRLERTNGVRSQWVIQREAGAQGVLDLDEAA